mmetsp:Transcript_26469/g.76422  ORF Transcript_26469/g.76422 Transcript_26469/m.76422 type:complete len:216 (-) Transcript_26469:1073-1720(-)
MVGAQQCRGVLRRPSGILPVPRHLPVPCPGGRRPGNGGGGAGGLHAGDILVRRQQRRHLLDMGNRGLRRHDRRPPGPHRSRLLRPTGALVGAVARGVGLEQLPEPRVGLLEHSLQGLVAQQGEASLGAHEDPGHRGGRHGGVRGVGRVRQHLLLEHPPHLVLQAHLMWESRDGDPHHALEEVSEQHPPARRMHVHELPVVLAAPEFRPCRHELVA